jgi:hypothetical protein
MYYVQRERPEGIAPPFLTSTLVEGEQSVSRLSLYITKKIPPPQYLLDVWLGVP